jgi:hypothetical protein
MSVTIFALLFVRDSVDHDPRLRPNLIIFSSVTKLFQPTMGGMLQRHLFYYLP